MEDSWLAVLNRGCVKAPAWYSGTNYRILQHGYLQPAVHSKLGRPSYRQKASLPPLPGLLITERFSAESTGFSDRADEPLLVSAMISLKGQERADACVCVSFCACLCGCACAFLHIHVHTHTHVHPYYILPIYLPTDLCTYIHIHIPTYVPTYLPTYVSTYLHSDMLTYLLVTHTHMCRPACPTDIHAYIPTCIPTNIRKCIHTATQAHT